MYIFLFCYFVFISVVPSVQSEDDNKNHRYSIENQVICKESMLPLIRSKRAQRIKDIVPTFPTNVLECMSWKCVCHHVKGAVWKHDTCHMPGGTKMRKEVRKEYRMLSTAEKHLYRRSFLAANKRGYVYNTLSRAHSESSLSPAAHNGPHFLPWHREFLKRLIIGIRIMEINGKYPFASVSLPYWDSSLDDSIRQSLNISSKNSVFFSPYLLGSAVNGTLKDGDFGGYVGRQGPTKRELDRFGKTLGLFKRSDIERISSYNISGILSATAGSSQECRKKLPRNALELLHGNAHVWVGGSMKLTRNATNDPIFVLHHTFVDMLWEKWRKEKQNIKERETQWNNLISCYSSHHKSSAILKPFGLLTGLEGCSNKYAEMTTYIKIPRCKSYCRSKYLYCNKGYCVSRVKPNGSCRLIDGIDPCFQSKCSSKNANIGTCVSTHPKPRDSRRKGKIKSSHVPKKNVETCFNLHECCDSWANRELCFKNSVVNIACPYSCGDCKPTTYQKTNDCKDRHFNCKELKRNNQCKFNHVWMAENCRETCELCKTRRICSAANNSKQTNELAKQLRNNRSSKNRIRLRSLFM